MRKKSNKPNKKEEVQLEDLRFNEDVFVKRPTDKNLDDWFKNHISMGLPDGTNLERLIAYYFDCGFCIGRSMLPQESYYDKNGDAYKSLGSSSMAGLGHGISIIQKGLLLAACGNSKEFDKKHDKIINNPQI